MHTCICFWICAFYNRKYACVCVCVCVLQCVCVWGGDYNVHVVCVFEHIGCVRTCDFLNAQCPLSPKSVAMLITSLTDV